MARLTRSQSQALNRQHLLSAAEKLFLQDGYHAVSTAKIAHEAELSTGALYSNFGGKQEIGLHVIQGVQQRYITRLEPILGAIPDPAALPAIRAWVDDALQSGWPRLELEFALDARSDPKMVLAQAERHTSMVSQLTGCLRRIGPGHTPLAPQIAEAVINLIIGLAVRHLIDPHVSARPAYDLLEIVLATLGASPPPQQS